MSPSDIVGEFNDCINRQDLDGLARVMSETHKFVDSAGNTVSGKTACIDAWRGFFSMFPDYRNRFDRMEESGRVVAVLGASSCSDSRLDGPALWKAVVVASLVEEWHVYEDTEADRAALGLSG